MSLTTALKIAQSSFSNTAQQTAVVSSNIANASNPAYNRRSAVLASAASGATIVETFRAQNDALQKQNLLSISRSYAQDTTLAGMERMRSTLGGDDYELSTANYLSKLRDDLQTFADRPSEQSLAETVVADAADVASSLKSASQEVQQLRADADADITLAVAELNRLLGEFKTFNDQVKGGTAAGRDVSDALDQRDKLVGEISGIVGVTTVVRTNNDLALYTSDGTTLFETLPRTVSFTPTSTYTAGTAGNPILVDGVAIAAGTGGNTTAQGTLPALLQLRDDVAPTYQSQLDEMARAVITMFQDAGQPGLFTWMDGATQSTTVPGGLTDGLADSIIVNPALVTSAGGNPMLLRDGVNVNQNTGNDASYSTLLDAYAAAFSTDMSFDVGTGIDTSTSILNFSTNSIGWIEQLRSAAVTANGDKSALLARTQSALQNVTAVSLDEELSLLLDLEQSYQASAKLVTTVDEMMTALLQAAG